VVPRRELFVPDVDEGFFVFMEYVSLLKMCSKLHDSNLERRHE
jgi:hypothetical protein